MMVTTSQLFAVHACANFLIPLCAGAPQGDPGDRQQRSLRAPSSGVRQEEADSSQAAHAQDGRGVSATSKGNLSERRGKELRSLKPSTRLLQVGLWEEAWQHQAGEGAGASEAQVQAGAQGRPEGDQEGLTLPGQREAQGGHGQVSERRAAASRPYLFID